MALRDTLILALRRSGVATCVVEQSGFSIVEFQWLAGLREKLNASRINVV